MPKKSHPALLYSSSATSWYVYYNIAMVLGSKLGIFLRNKNASLFPLIDYIYVEYIVCILNNLSLYIYIFLKMHYGEQKSSVLKVDPIDYMLLLYRYVPRGGETCVCLTPVTSIQILTN